MAVRAGTWPVEGRVVAGNARGADRRFRIPRAWKQPGQLCEMHGQSDMIAATPRQPSGHTLIGLPARRRKQPSRRTRRRRLLSMKLEIATASSSVPAPRKTASLTPSRHSVTPSGCASNQRTSSHLRSSLTRRDDDLCGCSWGQLWSVPPRRVRYAGLTYLTITRPRSRSQRTCDERTTTPSRRPVSSADGCAARLRTAQ